MGTTSVSTRSMLGVLGYQPKSSMAFHASKPAKKDNAQSFFQ
jgi:hypothetical protein